jgi:hypothetical protein
MAGLPLYLIAIPLRRSLAAGMGDDVISYNSYMDKTLKRQALQRGARGAYMRFVRAQLCRLTTSVILSPESFRGRRIPRRDLKVNGNGIPRLRSE